MADAHSHDDLVHAINRVLTGELARFALPDDAARPSIVVSTTKTSSGRRPDGLRDDVTTDPGFSFAVAEGLIEVDRSTLTDEPLERVHRILWEAGTDDWMDYSQLNHFEAADVPKDATLALSFSSAAKAASVIMKLLAAL